MNEPKTLKNLSFEQAVNEKNKYPTENLINSNGEYMLYIAPNDESDYKNFYEFFCEKISEYTDELCKEYSSDERFQVRSHLISALK